MSDFDRLRVEVVNLVGDALDRVPEIDGDERERLTRLRERIERGHFYVLVCGEFKRGKSTLINALLEEPGLCPADVDIATSVVSTIAYAPVETVTAHVGKTGETRPVSITRADISQYVKEADNPGNKQEARVVEIGLPNEKLKTGLTLVDTPGVGGVNVEHTAVTYLFLPNADAVLFVGDATEPLSTKELEFLADVAGHAHTIVVAMTKMDLVVDSTVQVEAARDRVADRLGRSAAEIVVVPVSSKRKLNGLKLGDPEQIAESNYPDLERELWSGIGRRSGALQLSGGLLGLGEIVDRVRSPLAVERTALREESEPKLAELRAKITELKERSANLGRDRADWRASLTEGLDQAGQKVGDHLARDIDRIDARLETQYLEDEALLGDPDSLVQRVTKDLAAAVADAGRDFADQADNILTDLALQTSIDLNDLPGVDPPAFEATTEIGELRLDVGPQESSAVRMYRMARGATMGVGAAGVLAWTILGIASAPVLAVAALGGAALGIKEQLEQRRGTDSRQLKAAIQRQLRPVINENKRSASNSVKAMVRDAQKQMVKALEDRIKADRDAIQDMINSVDETGRLTAEEATKRQTEIDARLAEIDKLGRRAHELRIAVERLASEAPEPAAVSDLDPA